MKISDIIRFLEGIAPPELQESYDNSGLQTGDPGWDVKGVLCTLDVTEEVINEAIELGDNLILAHHPMIFRDIKSVTGKTYTERCLIKAIKNDIAVFVMHTNLDSIDKGVNRMICEKIGIKKTTFLSTRGDMLVKLVTFVPQKHAEKVRQALFSAGAGNIGNYDSCSYNIAGQGTFRAGDEANPFVGDKGKIHYEDEIRIETILTRNKTSACLNALLASHPYEEVAYDIYPLENKFNRAGAGMTGEFDTPVSHKDLMNLIREVFSVPVIRYSGQVRNEYKKVALCGGSGMFLLKNAIQNQAEVFITSDIKYHQFFDSEDKILVCDIGHYESEQFTKQLFYNLLIEKFSTFAVHLSKIVTNPIKYYS